MKQEKVNKSIHNIEKKEKKKKGEDVSDDNEASPGATDMMGSTKRASTDMRRQLPNVQGGNGMGGDEENEVTRNAKDRLYFKGAQSL